MRHHRNLQCNSTPLRCLCLALITLTAHFSVAAKSEVITVGFIERPPSIFQTAGGDMRGTWGRRIETLLQDARIFAKYQATQPEDIDQYVANLDLDGLIVTETLIGEQSDDYLFSSEPLFYLPFFAYHLVDTDAVQDITQLHNSSVIMPVSPEKIEGPLHKLINTPENQVTVVSIEREFERLIQAVRERKAQYGISYFSPDNVAVMFNRRSNRQSLVASELFQMPLYFVIRRDVDNARGHYATN